MESRARSRSDSLYCTSWSVQSSTRLSLDDEAVEGCMSLSGTSWTLGSERRGIRDGERKEAVAA